MELHIMKKIYIRSSRTLILGIFLRTYIEPSTSTSIEKPLEVLAHIYVHLMSETAVYF